MPDQGFCHLASEPWRPNVAWVAARFLVQVVHGAAPIHPGIALLVLLFVGVPALLFFLAGIPLWVWNRWGRFARADRSGLVFRGRRWSWEDVDAVVADNVEWRETEPPGIEHAVVLCSGSERWALVVSTFPRADELATKLEYLRRTARGTPDDVPPAIRAAVAAGTRAERHRATGVRPR